MTTWKPPSSERPRHFVFAMLERPEREHPSIAALAPTEWHAYISTLYTLCWDKRRLREGRSDDRR